MRNSRVLNKIRSGDCARICGLGHYMPFYIRFAAHNRYDGIWLDLEHRAMDNREVQSLLALMRHNDIDCMLRPPTRDRTRLYRYMEDGATGFMFPFVDDAETARSLVEIVKYPPQGNRGIDGAGLDADYGLDHFLAKDSTYLEDANRETFIVAQIETTTALSNLDEIAQVEGIDVLFVGPGDLGARLAHADMGDLDGAIEKVAAVAKSNGKAWGIPAGAPEAIEKYHTLGAQVMSNCGDFGVVKLLETGAADFDRIVGGA